MSDYSPKNTPRLDDLLMVRLSEYGRMLAGYAVSWPREVLQAIDRVDPQYFRDEIARAYILTLRDQRSEIDQAPDTSAAAAISLRLAEQSPDFYTLIGWAATAPTVIDFTRLDEIAKDLRRMAIAYNVIEQVQSLACGDLDSLRERIHNEMRGGDYGFTTDG